MRARREKTLRDEFAAAALQALLLAFAEGKLTPKMDGQRINEHFVAEQAYCFADAMMVARKEVAA